MSETMLTEMVFNALNTDALDMDFADSGNEIFVTDKGSGTKFTITIKQG